MKAVVQRVQSASVEVDGKVVGSIGPGLLVLFGVKKGDDITKTKWMADKIANLRIFKDAEEKMNLSLKDIGGEVLVVSQFTLYGDCEKGRRPSFIDALGGEEAEAVYEDFVNEMKKEMGKVATGIFGASMQVSLVNDGPVTIIVES
jgi:D-tyrosyl-tRNA(Tyr) deacylase